MKIGSHVGLKAPLMFEGSVLEAKSYGANCFMVYTGAPQSTQRRPIKELRIEEANNDLDFIVHAPYIVNLSNPDKDKRDFSIRFLTEEVKRAAKMGSNVMVLHPGNHLNQDLDVAINYIAEGIKKIIEDTKDLNVIIALETMSGKGSEIGKNFEELKQIIDIVDSNRVGVCFDTCHVWDAGYDLNDYESVILEFDRVIGIDKIKVFHINDSKNPLGAHKDRHENIGFGNIGFEILNKIIWDERFDDIPHILETPYIDGIAPYKQEIDMIKNKTFNPNLIEDVKNAD